MQQAIHTRNRKQVKKHVFQNSYRYIKKNHNTVLGTHFSTAKHTKTHTQINAVKTFSNSTGYRKVKKVF